MLKYYITVQHCYVFFSFFNYLVFAAKPPTSASNKSSVWYFFYFFVVFFLEKEERIAKEKEQGIYKEKVSVSAFWQPYATVLAPALLLC